MEKLIATVLLLATTCAFAADDLLNCKWENGEVMEPGICGTLRNDLPDAEKTRIHEELSKRSKDEAQERRMRQEALELEEAQARIRKAEEEEAARAARCSKIKSRPLKANEKRSIANHVKDQLKDPDSAKFKWMRLYGDDDVATYCGLVNAKNSYGGYIGYTVFSVLMVNGKANNVMMMSGDDEEIMIGFCKNYCYEEFSKANP